MSFDFNTLIRIFVNAERTMHVATLTVVLVKTILLVGHFGYVIGCGVFLFEERHGIVISIQVFLIALLMCFFFKVHRGLSL